MVNDNILDVVITPADEAGKPAKVTMRPETRFVQMDGQVATVEVRPLTTRPDRQPAGGRIGRSHDCAALHRHTRKPLAGDALAHNAMRVGEGGIRIAVLARPDMIDVIGHIFEQLRRAILARLEHIHDHRQRLPVHHHLGGGIGGDLGRDGDHRRHRLADMAGTINRERVVGWSRIAGRVGRCAAFAAADRHWAAQGRQVAASDHRHHAGVIQRRLRINATDACVAVGAAHKRDVVHARQLEIADIVAFAGDQPRIFLALDARADQR